MYNVLFLKFNLNWGKCRRLVYHVSWLCAIYVSVYQRMVHVYASWRHNRRFCLATGYTYSTVVVKVSHRYRKVENSRFCLERHY